MDPSNNTETEDETIALKKKRARRVSFADNEITSVHIFRRDDEDSETPPGSKPSSNSDVSRSENDILGFFRDLAGESDEDDLKEASPLSSVGGGGGSGDEDDDDGEVVDMGGSFLKPTGSPSPGGSSTAGSVASTDDDEDFHGPVSASFIKSGQFSDSAASDDDHDVTMDSTAFSLHYRSLARSDSGDLKTPTRFGIPSEEKTPSQTSRPAASGSSMVLTKVKQFFEASTPADVATASRDSNQMSIVGENPPNYDYDRLSPSLDAMLAEGSKDLSAVSVLVSSPSMASKGRKEISTSWNKNGYVMAKCAVDSAIGSSTEQDLSIEKLVGASSELVETNRCSVRSPMEQVTDDFLSRKCDHMVLDACTDQTQSPDCSIKEIKESVKTMIEPQQFDFVAANNGSPSKVDGGQVNGINPKDIGHVSNIDHKFDSVDGNPIQGLTPSLLAGREQLFLVTPVSSRQTGTLTPPSRQRGSFLFDEYVTHEVTLSSIRKSISNSRTLETSPSMAILKGGIDRLKHRLSKYSPGSALFSGKDSESKHANTLNAPSKEQLLSSTPVSKGHQNLTNRDDHGIEFAKNEGELRQHEETVTTVNDGEHFHCMSADISDHGKKTVEMVVASSPMTHITRKVIRLDCAVNLMENRKDEDATVTPDVSPVKFLGQKLSPSIEYQRNGFSESKHLDEHNESSNNGLKNPTNRISQTVAKELDLSFPRNGEKFSSPVGDTKVNKFSQSVSKRKLAESPVRGVIPLSNSREVMIRSPIQDESTLLPSTQEHLSDSLYHYMQSLSPLGNSDDPAVNNFHQMLKVAESPAMESALQISSEKKRKGTELLSDGQNIDKSRRISRGPEVYKSWSSDLELMLEQPDDIRNDTEKVGEQMWKNWADILMHFLGNTNQLLSPSVEKLNLRMIGTLEDILVRLQRVVKCDTMCSEIHSQKIIHPLNTFRHKRVVEARMLLYNIAYEKAKLQLIQVKHERLLKKIQQLSCGLKESQTLRLNCTPCFSRGRAPDTQANSHTASSFLNSEEKCQVSCNEVTTMRQELETLDGKAQSLSKLFHTYCNMQWDRSFADIIAFVHDNLKKRMSCMSIFQNLQLWEVDDFEHKDGFHRVLLNYCGYVIQRFTVNASPPSIIISNELNYQKICKTFPNMDSTAAFLFVSNPTNTTKKPTGSRCLAEETQITSLLLSNLLDVIEEVQLARIEIRNLIQANFNSQSVGHLDLQLSFIDFYSGMKVKVILDVTCLNCGVYPAEILPYQICDPHSGEQKSLPLSLVAEITSAAENTRVGYSRIIRLCRCISQAIHTYRPSR